MDRIYRAGIAGASGYTGFELIQLIHRHPQLEIGWITSESNAGGTFADVYLSLIHISEPTRPY